jgi:quinol monooxygenase YgiN
MVKFAVYAKIKADQRDEFLAALREYLPAVTAEPATLQYDVCEAESAPGTFLFYEAYPDDAGLKAHQESAAFKSYIAQIGPMLAEPPVSMQLLESAKA